MKQTPFQHIPKESSPLRGVIVSFADMTTATDPRAEIRPRAYFLSWSNHRRNMMKISLKYLVIVFVLLIVGSQAVASPYLAEARKVMLKCALTEVKPQIVYRAYDKTGNTTRRSSKVDKDESLEDALIRSNLGCIVKTIDSMLTYKKLEKFVQ